jgi:hypothetical protein
MITASAEFEFDPVRHEFWQNGHRKPSVTQVLAMAGICDFSCVDAELREYSMKRGTAVHWLTQLEDEGGLNYRTVPKNLRGYRKAFNTWKKRSGFLVTQIETKFVSKFGFAGIIDRVGMFPPNPFLQSASTAVVDIKTGDIADWVRFQLTPYTVAAAGDNPTIAEGIRRIALRLFPDGTYKIKEFPRSTWLGDWSRFIKELRGIDV